MAELAVKRAASAHTLVQKGREVSAESATKKMRESRGEYNVTLGQLPSPRSCTQLQLRQCMWGPQPCTSTEEAGIGTGCTRTRAHAPQHIQLRDRGTDSTVRPQAHTVACRTLEVMLLTWGASWVRYASERRLLSSARSSSTRPGTSLSLPSVVPTITCPGPPCPAQGPREPALTAHCT